jgi:undecaprenyl-diphosphatase
VRSEPSPARPTDVDGRAVAAAALCSATLFAFTFLDPWLLAYFRDADPSLIGFWRTTTAVGNGGWMIGACLAAAALAHGAAGAGPRARPGAAALRRRALFALTCVAGLGSFAAAVKMGVGRARPKLADALGPYHFEPLAFDYKLNSLPSGHATTLFALATALALIAPRWRPIYYAVAVWGALSRVAAGAHYLSDVILGAALGHYGAVALSRAAAARGLPVALAHAPAEGRGALRAGRVIAAAVASGFRRRVEPALQRGVAAMRRILPPSSEANHARNGAPVRGHRADA